MKKKKPPDELRGTSEFSSYYTSLPKKSLFYRRVTECLAALKTDRTAGNKVERDRWPKQCIDEYGITNLFRMEAGESRLTYTLIAEDRKIIACVLEFFLDHVAYERRFGY